MHNVAPTRALARRQRQYVTTAFVLAAAGIFVLVVGLALFVIHLAAPGSQAEGVFDLIRALVLAFGGLLLVIAMALVVRAFTLKADNNLADVTGRFLTRYLDAHYHFIRNVSKRGLGYLDGVLIGPPGVLVFRILATRDMLANDGSNWLKQNAKRQWVPAGINPTRQTAEDVQKMRSYLAAHRLADVPVYGVIVFATPGAQITTRDPVVPVTTLPSLVASLGDNYMAKERIDAARVTAVVRLLYED